MFTSIRSEQISEFYRLLSELEVKLFKRLSISQHEIDTIKQHPIYYEFALEPTREFPVGERYCDDPKLIQVLTDAQRFIDKGYRYE